jgi:hypothetical protein
VDDPATQRESKVRRVQIQEALLLPVVTGCIKSPVKKLPIQTASTVTQTRDMVLEILELKLRMEMRNFYSGPFFYLEIIQQIPKQQSVQLPSGW